MGALPIHHDGGLHVSQPVNQLVPACGSQAGFSWPHGRHHIIDQQDFVSLLVPGQHRGDGELDMRQRSEGFFKKPVAATDEEPL